MNSHMKVFLSFATPDENAAAAFKASIEGASDSIEVFFAPQRMRLGTFWLPQLEQAIEESDAFLILVGSTLGEWQKLEYYEAIRRHVSSLTPGTTEYPLIPVITAKQPPSLPFIKNIQWIQSDNPCAPNITTSVVRRLVEGVPLPVGDITRVINPYRGLLSLEEGDADFFFGRESEVRLATQCVLRNPGKLTVLIGNSGVGKSSLMNAGVIPSLRAKRTASRRGSTLEQPHSWSYETMRPGRRPNRSLVSTFARHWFDDPTDPLRAQRVQQWEHIDGAGSLVSQLIDVTEECLSLLGRDAPSAYFIYIDQLEEMFSPDTEVTKRFADNIADALEDPRVRLVGSFRADYYGRLQEMDRLFEASEFVDVRPLGRDGVREVLTRPAEALEVTVESHPVVEGLIDSTAGQPGGLPLLADFLTQAWLDMQSRGDRVLRLYEHEDAVRMGNSLARRADEVLIRYPQYAQTLRRLFTLKLIELPERGPPVRSEVYRSQCTDSEWELVELLSSLEWRLLVSGRDQDGRPRAEIAHDILLKQWPMLSKWIEEERQFLLWKSQTTSQMSRWKTVEDDQKSSALLWGIDLNQSQLWLEERQEDVGSELAEFIGDSIKAENERQQYNQEQIQMHRMAAIGQLAGGVAHDFNNVLTAIIGFSDLLLLKHKQSDPSFSDIMSIKQSANRASALTRQLLAYASRQTLRPQVLKLVTHLDDLTVLLRRLIGDRINYEFHHEEDIWLVKADLVQIEQVIINLVVNARDATPNGGHVTLTTRNVTADELEKFNYGDMPVANYVLIEVSDTGAGMSPETMAQIFEPFFSTKELGKGTGLGLSMVYGIVKQSGGYIYPESTIGKGATFRVFLPKYTLTEAEKESPLEEVPLRDLTGNERVLLVEDEEDVRLFSARALSSIGYKVYEAESGEEALRKLAELDNEIDLLVTDAVMSSMDGLKLVAVARERIAGLKVLIVSGYAEESIRRDLEADTSIGFLPKPYSLDQLAAAVRDAIERPVH